MGRPGLDETPNRNQRTPQDDNSRDNDRKKS
jgi:hypothetical protein